MLQNKRRTENRDGTSVRMFGFRKGGKVQWEIHRLIYLNMRVALHSNPGKKDLLSLLKVK